MTDEEIVQQIAERRGDCYISADTIAMLSVMQDCPACQERKARILKVAVDLPLPEITWPEVLEGVKRGNVQGFFIMHEGRVRVQFSNGVKNDYKLIESEVRNHGPEDS